MPRRSTPLQTFNVWVLTRGIEEKQPQKAFPVMNGGWENAGQFPQWNSFWMLSLGFRVR
jgi:hypothetical protein